MTVVLELERKVEALIERNTALERENKILREELSLLKQNRFGRSSESLDPGQLALFLTGLPATPPPTVVPGAEAPAPPKKPPKGHGRSAFNPDLPRQVFKLDLPEEERICTCCGKPLQLIGEDVTERGHIVPARVVVNRYERKKYACPDGHEVKTAAAPAGVIDGAKYEASAYADVTTSKYCDHLPLNRLEGIYKRQGLDLSKQTMWDMAATVDELAAQPILRQMHLELLQESALHADETPVTMRVEDGGGSRTGYVFGWRNLRESETSKVVIEFRESRGRDGPMRFLKDWSGTLIVDGYSGYDEVVAQNDIVRAGCWAHARRKLKEALDTGSREAAWVLVHVQRLFRLERAVNERAKRLGMSRDEHRALRKRVRAHPARRLLERIDVAARELAGRRGTLPKSKLGKALAYIDRQWQPLSVFLADPRIPIHNNDAERDLRHLAVGRNNWMVFASPRGGEVACRLYSLVLSCKEAGVDPRAYIEDVLLRVSTTPASQIASLTPWAWQQNRREAAANLG